MDWIKLQELQMTAFLDFNMAILKSATKDVFLLVTSIGAFQDPDGAKIGGVIEPPPFSF